MYLRTTKRKNRDGTEVAYYQLAESVWNADKQRSQAKVLYSFGRADGVDRAQLLRLADSIRRACGAPSKAAPAGPSLLEGFKLLPAKAYGGLYVINALWERVGLREIIGKLKRTRHSGRSTHELALFAMVANRLLAPSSKLACYDWLLDNVHFPEGAKLSLDSLYRSMDVLAKRADEVEEAAFWKLADLFSLDVDVIFFDTTTTYFEIDQEDGEYEPEPEQPRVTQGARRKRGNSKDKRGSNPQVVIALAVTRDGLPVRSWVFPGNTVDVETVRKVRDDLKGMRLTRLLFVGDSGFYSAANKKILSAGGGRYLLATPLRKVKELHDVVLKRAGRYKKIADNLEVKQVVVGDGARQRRYFVCRNLEEAARQRKHRQRLLKLLEYEMGLLKASSVEHPKKACKLLSSKRFGRYLKQSKAGRLSIDRAKVKAEARFDGKWVVTTNDDTLTPEDGALGYKAAILFEACFRRMKTSGLKLRPVFHWTKRRIRAHVKLCVLALLIQRVAEIACEDTWRNIRRELRTLQAVRCETSTGWFVQTTQPSERALALLRQLKLPAPPKLLETSAG